MSRIRNAVKKDVWKTLSPGERQRIFMYGDADKWALNFARRIFSVMEGIEERKNPKSIIQGLEFVAKTSKERGFTSAATDEKRLQAWRLKLPALLKLSRRPIKVFSASKKNSIEREIQEFLVAAADLLIESYRAKSGGSLRSLAKAIEISQRLPTKKDSLGFVDDHKFWINSFLYKSTVPPNSKLTNEPKSLTHAQIRDAFNTFFPNNNVDDKTLRDHIKDLEFRCEPDKRGPKGPRIRL
jgi:hypothetical protein